MPIRRIVSLLPSATELIYELGLQDMLFGVTHECLYPADAASKPQVVSAVFDPESMSSSEIDEKTRKLAEEGAEIFRLDGVVLRDARPDLIVSQSTCEVCAAHGGRIDAALRVLQRKPQVYSMDPHGVAEILDGVVELAEMLGAGERGAELRRSLEARLERVAAARPGRRPRVLALEWLDPFFTSGHWVPEMIELAGGENLISRAGERSRTLHPGEIAEADPDVIILMPCGFGTGRTVLEYRDTLHDRDGWRGLRAVGAGQVYAVDANSYFSKPSIRTVTGVEILARILHPGTFANITVPPGSFSAV